MYDENWKNGKLIWKIVKLFYHWSWTILKWVSAHVSSSHLHALSFRLDIPFKPTRCPCSTFSPVTWSSAHLHIWSLHSHYTGSSVNTDRVKTVDEWRDLSVFTFFFFLFLSHFWGSNLSICMFLQSTANSKTLWASMILICFAGR